MQECFCFPIILLMFTENTIKHNMIMGEELRVRITGSLVERNGEKYVVLTHLDSGSGYFEEDLEYLNRPVSQQVHDFDGKKIGTYNLLKRLYLVYGEKAHAAFFQRTRMGCKIRGYDSIHSIPGGWQSAGKQN